MQVSPICVRNLSTLSADKTLVVDKNSKSTTNSNTEQPVDTFVKENNVNISKKPADSYDEVIKRSLEELRLG